MRLTIRPAVTADIEICGRIIYQAFKDIADRHRSCPTSQLCRTASSSPLVAGTKIDAVAANNDEMAIGAIIALQQAGEDPKKIVIGGIDATPDALTEMEKGNLAVTVFQDSEGQGKAVVDSAVKLIKGEKFDSPYIYIPFQLVTRENYKEFLNK